MLTFDRSQGRFLLNSPSYDVRQEIENNGLDFVRDGGTYKTTNPYAAFHYYGMADMEAEVELIEMKLSYDLSWSTEGNPSGMIRPEGLEYTPFQAAGISYARDTHNVLIGDEMGLGKTVQAIGVANECRMSRILAVVPAAARIQWEREIRRWYVPPKDHRVRVHTALKGTDGVAAWAHWNVLSYPLVTKPAIHEVLQRYEWDMIVLDELHYLKTYQANRTRAIFGGMGYDGRLADRAAKIVGLTGTPLPNRPRECYTVARNFDWQSINHLSEERFYDRYNPRKQMGNKHVVESKYRLSELHNRLRCNFMVRRLKKDVLHQLPELKMNVLYLDQDQKVRKVTEAERLLDIDPLNLDADQEAKGHIAVLRREMGEAKAPQEVARVKMVMEDVEKFAVFAWHRSVLDILEEGLKAYKPVRIDGSCTQKVKDRRKRLFMNDPKRRLFLGQIQSAGTAMDGLQYVCSDLDIVEPSWTPGENEQVCDRFWRMEQKFPVTANICITPDSYDEKVVHNILTKRQSTATVLDYPHLNA